MTAVQLRFVVCLLNGALAFSQQSPSNWAADSGRGSGTLPKMLSHRVPVTKANAQPRTMPSISLLGSVATASPAQSFALNGNIAYTCDNNEISAIDIINPAHMKIWGTVTAPIIQNSGLIYCALQRDTLVVFSDQTSSTIGNSPGFVAFSLTDPKVPTLIGPPTPSTKRFFGGAVYRSEERRVGKEC